MSIRFDQPDLPGPDISRARALRLQRQFRIRTIMLAILIAAVWFAYLRIPGAWLLVAGPIVALGIGAGMLGLGMALAFLGILFFGWVERCLVRMVRGRPASGPGDDWRS